MQAFLELIAEKRVTVRELIDRVYSIGEAVQGYTELKGKKVLAGLFKYEAKAKAEDTVKLKPPEKKDGVISVGLVGAGNFAQSTHLPNLSKSANYSIYGICDLNGKKAKTIAEQYSASVASTSPEKLFADKNVDAVFICTTHNSHADLVVKALKAGKHVFVEKPLALTEKQLNQVKAQLKKSKTVLMVGHNRKYSSHARAMKARLDPGKPSVILCRVDAGYVPKDSWIQDPDTGGGRLIGEAVHFFDLFYFLTGSKPVKIEASSISPGGRYLATDNISVTISHENGSVSSLVYTAMGSTSQGKERVEAFQDGNTLVIDAFESMSANGRGETSGFDKGSATEIEEFAEAIHGIRDLSKTLERDILATKTALEVMKLLK